MQSNDHRPKRTESGNSIVVPLIAAVAVAIALVFSWGMMNSKNDYHAANPADQSSSTGASSGDSGKSTVQYDPEMKANPGAGAAPTKAQGSNLDAADTQPQPKP